MKRKKCDVLISCKGNSTKVYINGKWKKGITKINFSAEVIPCKEYKVKRVLEYEYHKKVNGKYVIENNELVKEKRIVEIN